MGYLVGLGRKGGAGVQDIVWGEGLSGEDANVCFSSGAGCDQ